MNKKIAAWLMNNLSLYLVHTPVKRALIVMVCSLSVLLASLILWIPNYLATERYSGEVLDLQREISNLKSKTAIAKNLQRNRNALTEVTRSLNQSISQATLIKELNRVVSATGVIMTDQAFREVSVFEGMDVYRQALVISGSYGKIRNFISQLSTGMPGLNVIVRIAINKETGAVVSANVDLDTYSVRAK